MAKYRVCAYCRKREYGANIGKTMTLAPDGKNFLSEAHFVHVKCLKNDDSSPSDTPDRTEAVSGAENVPTDA